MCKYLELKKENQKRFDEFAKDSIYWIFAFSQKDFDKKLKEHNLIASDLVSIGAGGFIKKESKENYLKLFRTLNANDEFKAIQHDDDEVIKAFKYELANHEYCITYDLTDTLEALNIDSETFYNDDRLKGLMYVAKKQYLANYESM